MASPRIIGLNGKKGSGKDTAGAYLVEQYGYERASFAAPLKSSAAASLGLPPDPETFEEWKNNPDARVILTVDGIEEVNISVREFLQFYGTEGHRNIPIFGQSIWTVGLLNTLDPEKKYVITDARFVNECTAVREAGGTIIVIDRPGTDGGDSHASEDDLPAELVDTVLYNGSDLAHLYSSLDAYMEITAASDEPLSAVGSLFTKEDA